MLNELIKTVIFVAVASVLALVAVGSHFLNRPSNSSDFELVGQPFYEEFTSAKQAMSLEVAAVDSESAKLKRFSVKNKDGLWRIPSHYDYPAEAAARLATTASSVMGIERESLAGRLAKEHERLGVVDPLSDEIEDPESVGQRITMKDASGEIVVDYIIGKEAGDVVLSETERPFGSNENEKYYYVRRPDEQQTYKVALKVDLSTKFSDWIDPDLLRVDRNEITKLFIDNYSLSEDRTSGQQNALFKSQGDKIELVRKTSTDAWELTGLDAAAEELQTARINQMLGIFDQMKIAGVRPKFKYKDHLLLTSDLKLNVQPEFETDPNIGRAINRLQNELDQKGFSLAGTNQKMELVARNGDLHVGTDKGVVYTLHVGSAFDGDETEIEIGGTAETEDSESSESDPDAKKSEADAETKKGDPATEAVEEAENRYLMVRVSFDEALIVPQPVQPVPPVAPVAPEGYEPPKPVDAKVAQAKEAAEEGKPGPPPIDETPRSPEFVKHDEALKAFENAQLEYELAKTKFKEGTDAFAKKVVEGKALVDELNERFGDWYYVITGDNLSTLQTKRADLVTKKTPPPGSGERPDAGPPRPDISFPALPGQGGRPEPELPAGATKGTGDESKTPDLNDEGKSDPGESSKSDEAGENAKAGDEAPKPKSESDQDSKQVK